MALFRTEEMSLKYKAFRDNGGLEGECALCMAPALHTFIHWKVIENKFPYDKVAQIHHMIVPKKHIAEEEIAPEAWAEWRELKNSPVLNDAYDFIIEAVPKNKSIPGHFHFHLVVAKD